MASSSAGKLARIDPRTNKVIASVRVPSGSFCPIFFGGYVWITSSEHSVLSKVDPRTNRVVARIPVGRNPRFLTAGAGSIWTLNQGDGTVTRVDAKTNRRVADIKAGLAGKGGEIAFGFNSVWATLEQFPITRIDASDQLHHDSMGRRGRRQYSRRPWVDLADEFAGWESVEDRARKIVNRLDI